jgi:Flp pilus assembly protein TadG
MITKSRNKRGTAMVEFAMTALLIFGMLIGAFDFGLYAYAFISIQNAARTAALRNSGGPESATDQNAACGMVLEEVRGLPNIGATWESSCDAAPLVVTSTLCDNATPCWGSTTSADGQPAAAVVVSYTMPSVFHLQGVLPEVITRATQMKIRNVP